MYIYIYIYLHILYIYICNHENISFDSLVPTVWNRTSRAQVPGCHKAIVVIDKRVHCFHDCIYILYIFQTASWLS